MLNKYFNKDKRKLSFLFI